MSDPVKAQPKDKAVKPDAIRDATPYIVTHVAAPLTIMTDDAQLRAMLAGGKIPLVERDRRLAQAGEVVTDLPAISVPLLLAAGKIRPMPSAEDLKAVQAAEIEAWEIHLAEALKRQAEIDAAAIIQAARQARAEAVRRGHQPMAKEAKP